MILILRLNLPFTLLLLQVGFNSSDIHYLAFGTDDKFTTFTTMTFPGSPYGIQGNCSTCVRGRAVPPSSLPSSPSKFWVLTCRTTTTSGGSSRVTACARSDAFVLDSCPTDTANDLLAVTVNSVTSSLAPVGSRPAVNVSLGTTAPTNSRIFYHLVGKVPGAFSPFLTGIPHYQAGVPPNAQVCSPDSGCSLKLTASPVPAAASGKSLTWYVETCLASSDVYATVNGDIASGTFAASCRRSSDGPSTQVESSGGRKLMTRKLRL